MSLVPPPSPVDEGHPLPELSERQELILSLLVREHIRDAQPVGSKRLVEQFNLGVSSATVRNEMAVLEEYGLIYAPHTSAGRVPTPQGYRYFVRRLLTGGDLSAYERRKIAQTFRQAPADPEEWMRLAAMILSRTSQTAALVTAPRAIENHFKHVELISTQGRMVLMVLVLQGGSVHQQVLTLAEPVTQPVLSQTAAVINRVCSGQTAEQVRARTRTLPDELSRDVCEVVADAMAQADQQGTHDGTATAQREPGHIQRRRAQQVVRVMEEQSLLDGILRETLSGDRSDVRVVVAGEGRWEDLSHLSMVLGALWHAARGGARCSARRGCATAARSAQCATWRTS